MILSEAIVHKLYSPPFNSRDCGMVAGVVERSGVEGTFSAVSADRGRRSSAYAEEIEASVIVFKARWS